MLIRLNTVLCIHVMKKILLIKFLCLQIQRLRAYFVSGQCVCECDRASVQASMLAKAFNT